MKISTYIRNKKVIEKFNKGYLPKEIAFEFNLTQSNVYKIISQMKTLKKQQIKILKNSKILH